mmetsp:Transcript_82709/g.238995  ORF Transcript_82709/g.238995 Transcript_82709/m.238995 type:complete len:237 (-) Transcript_82709:75-785(-)
MSATESSPLLWPWLASPEVVEYGANMCATFFMLSPCAQMIQLFRRRGATLNSINPLTMILLFTNCSLWLSWGYFLPMPPAIPANLLGLIAGSAYLAICWGYATVGKANAPAWGQRTALQTSGMVMMSLVLARYAATSTMAAEHVGYLAMIISVCLFASPLSELARVLEERCSERLPPLQCAMQFLSTFLWLVVGLRKSSVQIIVCNGLGFALAAVQVGLIATLPSVPARKKEPTLS